MRKWFLIMATAVVLCSACGKKDASVNDVTQAAQASSTEAENLYKEGSQYVGEEDYESAIESLLKCIELDPDYSKAYIQLSKAYIGNEEYDEAMAILQQGYEKTKDTSLEKEQDNCVRTICQVLTDNEDYETAIPWLLKLQELDGVTVENSLQLAEAYSIVTAAEFIIRWMIMKMQCQFFRKQIRMMQVLKMPCWRQELPTDSTATMKERTIRRSRL